MFWHAPADGVDPVEYERKLLAFHNALSSDPSPGLSSSTCFSVQGASWLPMNVGYEDWYLLSDFDALGQLERASVSGSRASPHQAVASLAAWGTAGIYRPLTDVPASVEATTALWFNKPRGMSYATMTSRLTATEPDVSDRVWQRVLTLGPTPEFCLIGRGSDALPYSWSSQLTVRRPLKV
jgi:hypothetical protein